MLKKNILKTKRRKSQNTWISDKKRQADSTVFVYTTEINGVFLVKCQNI